MSIEIERRFRLDSQELLHRLQEEGLRLDYTYLRQVYTLIEPELTERYRNSGKKITKTIKKGSGLTRQEHEEEASEETFKIACSNALGKMIQKERYSFKLQGFEACIDCFEGFLDGLFILEVEFPDVNSANNFTLPHFVKAKEITSKGAFTNAMLALYGVPLECLEPKELFQMAEKKEFTLQLISAHMPSYDAFRAIFYNLLLKIRDHRNIYLSSSDEESLHQFRINLRKTRSLLQTVDGLFDFKIAKHFIDGFSEVAKSSNLKRDLDVFELFLKTIDIDGVLDYEIRDRKEQEDEKIKEFLKSKKVENFLNEWQVVIEDDEGFFESSSAKLPFKLLGALSMKRQILTLSKKLKSLQEFTPTKKFHQVRIEFKRLRYLLEEFELLFIEDDFSKILERVKKMQKIFGKLQDKSTQKELLKVCENSEAISQNVESISFIEELLVEVKYDIYKSRKSILHKKGKAIKALKA
ncbi:MAG: CHAD domain-containing protein, partial [Campylobacteraceae bacterium]|nr:CHAD domain-containing protein [Campylobacteraceae bacterium]